MRRILFMVFLLWAFAARAATPIVGAPAPQEVSGALESGATLLVRGEGFGARGPQIVLFDDFESAQPGAGVDLEGAPIGQWHRTENDPVVVDGGRSGGVALSAYDGQKQRQVTLALEEKHREIFISFWVRVPPGTRFPGRTSGARSFSSDSSWKLTWLMDGERGFGVHEAYDICLPTFTGSGAGFQLGGNTYLAGDRYLGDRWWSWSQWMRVTTWIRNPQDKTPGGVFDVVSEDRGYFRRDFDAPTDRLRHRDQQFDVLNIPGWIREGGGSRVQPLYDDVYVAVGPAAAARVELVNAASYEDATRIELLLVGSWDQREIEAQVPRAVELGNGPWYLFVTDAEGTRNAVGLALCSDCPRPPALRID